MLYRRAYMSRSRLVERPPEEGSRKWLVAELDRLTSRVRRQPNPVIRLGAKTATAIELHADGRLECSLHAGAGEAEETFVAFDASHLDQLLLKFAAQGA